MPSPFPGMDPYLEAPSSWPDVHLELISKIRGFLNPRMLPSYVVRVEERVYVTDDNEDESQQFIPDVIVATRRNGTSPLRGPTNGTMVIDEPLLLTYPAAETKKENFITIRDKNSNRIVTIIEVLSPTNKTRGSNGRQVYMEKREKLMAGTTHLLEIDLLRAGQSVLVGRRRLSAYEALLSRGDDRRRLRCWPIRLRERLPVIGVPLKGRDPDVPLDLGEVLRAAYESGAYERVIDYASPCDPPLTPPDARWAGKLLQAGKLR